MCNKVFVATELYTLNVQLCRQSITIETSMPVSHHAAQNRLALIS